MHEECHEFPGMLRSLDCMHWAWKNCPITWKGQYIRGDHGHSTIILEVVALIDLWIWHAYFGVAESNNNLNVFSGSNLFHEELQGKAPEVYFNINGATYTMGYYLTNGIYPKWAAFVKSFSHPQDPKRLCFKRNNESARKGVERAFGLLQARFSIIREPTKPWHKSKLHDIMEACIILHNMIVEYEHHTYARTYPNEIYSQPVGGDIQQGMTPDFQAYLAKDVAILDRPKASSTQGRLG